MNKLSFLAAALLLLPQVALAAPTGDVALSPFRPLKDGVDRAKEAAETAEERVEQEVCKRLGAQAVRIHASVADRADRVEERVQTRAERLSSERNSRDEGLMKSRTAHAERRFAMYEKLRQQADTAEEEAAVDAFEAAIEDAVGARQSAADAAIEAFRAGVDDLSKDHVSAVLERKRAFEAAMETAIASAKADCEDAAGEEAAERKMKRSIVEARQKLMSEQVRSEQMSDAVSDLAEERREAIDEANRDFRIKVQEATLALKNAFGE